jgi:ketosteroid isomerase-like protein
MKHSYILMLCTFLLGLLTISFPVWSQKAEDELLKTEISRFEAMTQNDFEVLEQILADDLIYTHSSAKVDNKSQYLADLKSGAVKYNTIKPEEVKVRLYSNGNIGIITGKATVEVTSNGKLATLNLRYTNVYAKRKGKWQLVSWQSTRLPE